MTTLTSPTLIGRLQEDEPKAWDEYDQIYTPLIVHWIERSGAVPAHQILDVVQEVNIRVIRSMTKFNYQSAKRSFRGWLATITRNRIKDHLRGVRSGPSWVALDEDIADEETLPWMSDAESVAVLIRQAILTMQKPKLSVLQQEAMCLHFLDGVRMSEVAKQLSLNKGTLRNLGYACRARLQAVLSDELGLQ